MAVPPCEGGGDVVGVVTHLVGGVAQAFHDDQVVEVSVRLAAQEVEGKEEDRGRTGRSRRGEATQGGALMDDYGDVHDKTQTLSLEPRVYVRQHHMVLEIARSAFMLR